MKGSADRTKKRGFMVRLYELLDLMGKRYLAKMERSYGPMARGLQVLSELIRSLSTPNSKDTTKAPAAPTVAFIPNRAAPARETELVPLPEVLSEDDWFAKREREKLLALKSGGK
ncbi:MAG: hypothetical protein K2X77_33640 [Candidatus Obscuribacterales bacterium]|nr:hypothetical protein [Candidatus Obscuribacterales bacterium]